MDKINNVDICCGLAWGDEAKGKIVSQLSKNKNYDFVCRWAGGNNAGHTIYVDGKKYKTHLIPSGIFFGLKSIIGPDCVVNINAFFEEIEYLKENGFDTNLIQISPKAHIITASHIKEDKDRNKGDKTLGTTARGIGPCYRDKYARTGKRVMDFEENFKGYIWDGVLYGNVLCEGAQGVWLDINHGNYPYVTSSNPLPYGACSLGFPPQKIRNIYGAAKIYDTRVGKDPDFPDENILKIGNINYSNIIFSKKNILEVKVLNFKRWVLRMRNICISIKVKINDQEFWISNTHLNSDITGYHQLFQAQELQKYISDINEPHLILGDFNSPSNFYSISYLKKKLKIIEENKLTYPSIYPLVKLDYCFSYNFKKEINLETKKLKYSDHLPLIITID